MRRAIYKYKSMAFFTFFACCFSIFLSSCAETNTAEYSWTLPKTVMTVTAVYTFKGCTYDPVKQATNLQVSIAPSIVTKAVPDPNLGPNFKNGWVSIRAADLYSFWKDKSVEVKVFPNTHILQVLSSTSTDQTGTIISNVLTGVVKTAGIALGVPTAAENKAPEPGCGQANTTLENIASDQSKLKLLDPNSENAKTLASQIASLQNSLTITTSRTVDPGVTPVEPPASDDKQIIQNNGTVQADGRIALLRPSIAQLKAANWLSDEKISQISTDATDFYPSGLNLNVYLNFSKANPPILENCPPKPTACAHAVTVLDKGDLYREVAFVPVEIYKGDNQDSGATQENKILSEIIPFGQYGISRTLSISAPIFGKTNWSMTFADNGEQLDGGFGSAATGVAATSLISSAATGASSIDAENIKMQSQGSSEYQEMSIKNAELQAAINNANLTQQYEQLKAEGLVK